MRPQCRRKSLQLVRASTRPKLPHDDFGGHHEYFLQSFKAPRGSKLLVTEAGSVCARLLFAITALQCLPDCVPLTIQIVPRGARTPAHAPACSRPHPRGAGPSALPRVPSQRHGLLPALQGDVHAPGPARPTDARTHQSTRTPNRPPARPHIPAAAQVAFEKLQEGRPSHHPDPQISSQPWRAGLMSAGMLPNPHHHTASRARWFLQYLRPPSPTPLRRTRAHAVDRRGTNPGGPPFSASMLAARGAARHGTQRVRGAEAGAVTASPHGAEASPIPTPCPLLPRNSGGPRRGARAPACV